MRIPAEVAIHGGESDCRNRIIQQMFLMIGLGERAGSGVPKIFNGWKSGQWRPPALYEKDHLEQTLLELRMINLFPATPDQVFGKSLSVVERSSEHLGSSSTHLESGSDDLRSSSRDLKLI